MFLFFFKIFIYYILGKFYFAHFTPICSFSFFKIFPSSGGFIFRALYPFSRTFVHLEKNACSFSALKFSYSTTLKCIIIHILHIHILPYFTCKNMTNYFFAGWVIATISSNNLPFRTPYATPIVTTWNI